MSSIDPLPLSSSQVLVVEKIQLAEEPPLAEICRHKFQVDVAALLPERKHLSEEVNVCLIHVFLP